MLAHKENPQKTLFSRDSKAVVTKLGIRFGVCNNPLVYFLHCECTQRPVIPHHHNPPSTDNKKRAAKPCEKWAKMAEFG